MRCLNLVVILVLAPYLNSPAIAQRTTSHNQNASLVKFDWNCSSSEAYEKKRLDRIVRLTIDHQNFSHVTTWPDRAVAFDLNGDNQSEYFVPLVCGGTGNCAWGLFALGPLRRLAIINGEYIYIQRRRGQWPKLIVYGHLSVVEGTLTTYDMTKGRYVQSSRHLPINRGKFALEIQGGMGNKMPKFLEAAKPLCEAIGS
jgi:hypothetical protein